MKKTTLIATFALAATSAFLHAVDSYSETVGYHKLTLSPNTYKGIGISMVNPAVISGAVSSKSGLVVTLSNASSLGGLLSASPAAYYLEVVSPTNSPNIGDRFEVDVVATKAANNNGVILVSNARNTADASGASLAAGTGVVVRKHVTLDQVRTSITGTLVGDDNSAASADVIYLHNGNSFVPFWLGADLQSWYSNEDPDDHRNDVIAPGQGLLFYKRGSSATFTSTGYVRANDYKQVLAAGYQLNASGFPRDYSPVDVGGTLANGWAANDKIYVHNGVGFTTYTLFGNGDWDDGETPDPANTTKILDGGTAFLTKLASPNTDIEVKP